MRYRVEIRRNKISEEPFIVQEKLYITPKEKSVLKAAKLLIAEESDIPKDKRNHEFIQHLEGICSKITQGFDEKYEIFSDGSIFFNCIGKHVHTSDGWMITKRIL